MSDGKYNVYAEKCPTRQALDRIADKWTALIVGLLGQRTHRFGELRRGIGVNHNEQAPLRVVEHLVMDSGVPFTILRPNFFMENFSEGPQANGIRTQNAIYLAAGDGKTSFVSTRDVAAAVLAVLRQSLTGREVDLTGPAALDHVEVARIISGVTGRPIAYHALTEKEMLEGARSHGMPEPNVAYLGVLYGVVRAGYSAAVTADFQTITGRPPMTFDAFALAAAPAWR